MKKVLIFSILLLLIFTGCRKQEIVQESVCNAPYYEFMKEECCLDLDHNKVCDKDEVKEKINPEPVKEEPKAPVSEAKVVNDAMPAVLKIVSGPDKETQGSAFFISPDGHVITTYYHIENLYPDHLNKISFIDKYKNEYKDFEVVGYSYDYAFALLKIKSNKTFPYLTFGNSESLKLGDEVFALGNPTDYDFSASSGIISAVKREGWNNPKLMSYLQTDAAINYGSSGGPLLNKAGEVIGLNSFWINKKYYEGLNFALESNKMKELYDNIIYASKYTTLSKPESFYQMNFKNTTVQATNVEGFVIHYGKDNSINTGTEESDLPDKYMHYYSVFSEFKVKLTNTDSITHDICFDVKIIKEGVEKINKRLEKRITLDSGKTTLETVKVALETPGARDAYYGVATVDCKTDEVYNEAVARHYELPK